MKRLIIVLLLGMIVLSGCKKAAKEPDMTNEDYNIEGERVVLFCGEKQFPISFSVDGKQMIENGTYFYYDLNQKFDREWTDSFYLYHPDQLELIDFKEYGSFNGQLCFATNGNWPLFLNPVHLEFSSENQDRIDVELLNAGRKILDQNNMKNEPLILTDIWSCDIDHDAKEEFFFKGCNYIEPKGNSKNELLEDEVCVYSFLGYFDDGNCQVLDGSFQFVMNEQKNKEAETVLSSLTFDDKGNLVSSNLKQGKGYTYLKKLYPIIADPNGDQNWSIYVCSESDFKCLTMMDLKDGTFVEQFKIIY